MNPMDTLSLSVTLNALLVPIIRHMKLLLSEFIVGPLPMASAQEFKD